MDSSSTNSDSTQRGKEVWEGKGREGMEGKGKKRDGMRKGGKERDGRERKGKR